MSLELEKLCGGKIERRLSFGIRSGAINGCIRTGTLVLAFVNVKPFPFFTVTTMGASVKNTKIQPLTEW